MSKKCAICHKPLESGVVVHAECVQRWIPVTERLPEEGDMVLVVIDRKDDSYDREEPATLGVGIYHGGKYPRWDVLFFGGYCEADLGFVPIYSDDPDDEVTHWMPKPKSPEVE